MVMLWLNGALWVWETVQYIKYRYNYENLYLYTPAALWVTKQGWNIFRERFWLFTPQRTFWPFLRIRPIVGFMTTIAPNVEPEYSVCVCMWNKQKLSPGTAEISLFLKGFTRLPKKQTHVRQ